LKIDHIAIAVTDVEESAKVYQQALGVSDVEFETVESEGVKVAIIHLENGRIELMQPTNDTSPIKKFLDKKGQGLHHMALDTGDIEGKLSVWRVWNSIFRKNKTWLCWNQSHIHSSKIITWCFN